MRDTKDLLAKTRKQLASSKNTPIEAGQKGSDDPAPDRDAVIDAINQMFAEFELVYHNQYHKAFPTPEKLGYGKKLWFSNLCHIPPAQIIAASHRAIRESEFLPTVKGILKYCEPDDLELGLPDSHSAYLEACRAPNPKADYSWSHPAVYHAGKASDWYFLATTVEAYAYPVFRRHYDTVCQRLRNGEQLSLPAREALPEHIGTPLSPEEQKAKMRELRKQLDI